MCTHTGEPAVVLAGGIVATGVSVVSGFACANAALGAVSATKWAPATSIAIFEIVAIRVSPGRGPAWRRAAIG